MKINKIFALSERFVFCNWGVNENRLCELSFKFVCHELLHKIDGEARERYWNDAGVYYQKRA